MNKQQIRETVERLVDGIPCEVIHADHCTEVVFDEDEDVVSILDRADNLEHELYQEGIKKVFQDDSYNVTVYYDKGVR